MTQGFRQLIRVNDKAWIPDPHCAWEGARCFISLEGCHTALGTWLRFLYKAWTPASLPHQWRDCCFLTCEGWYTVLVIWHNFDSVPVHWPHDCVRGGAGTASLRLESVSGTSYYCCILTPDRASGGAVLPGSCSLKVPQTKGLWYSPRVWGLVLTDFLCSVQYVIRQGSLSTWPWCLLLEFAPLKTIIPVYMCVLLGHLQSKSLETSSLAWR